jgi:TolB-like protein
MFCGSLFVQAQEMDKELSDLATKLATLTKDNGRKKVSVLDFTDLNGAESELGKYIAEELTVNLVMVKKDFSVLDRANLRKILAEHKLTATGLVDPENAKKLGQFAGVDALILGTIVPKGQKISLTAKIITTDTAEIVGAAKAEFKEDDTAKQLLSRTATEVKAGDSSSDSKEDHPKVVKSFGDLRVELEPLSIVNGNEYLLTMSFANQNPKNSIWLAISYSFGGQYLIATVTDPGGNEFVSTDGTLSGVEYAWHHPVITRATEIKSKESITATTKFVSRNQRKAAPGTCRLQMELLLSHNFRDQSGGTSTVQNLITKIVAE